MWTPTALEREAAATQAAQLELQAIVKRYEEQYQTLARTLREKNDAHVHGEADATSGAGLLRKLLALSEQCRTLKDESLQATAEKARAVDELHRVRALLDTKTAEGDRAERQVGILSEELTHTRQLLDAKAKEADQANRQLESMASGVATEKEQLAAAMNEQLAAEAKLRREQEHLRAALQIAATKVKQLEEELAQARLLRRRESMGGAQDNPKGLAGAAASLFTSVSSFLSTGSSAGAKAGGEKPAASGSASGGAGGVSATAAAAAERSLADSVSGLAAQYVFAALPLPSRVLTSIAAHRTEVNALRFVPTSAHDRILLAASSDGTISAWDAHTGRSKCVLLTHSSNNAVLSLDVDSQGACVAGCSDRMVRVYDLATQRVTRSITMAGKVHAVVCASSPGDTASMMSSGSGSGSSSAFSRGMLLTGGSDRVVKVFDYRDARCVRTIDAKSIVNAIAVDPSSTVVAVGTQAGSIHTFDLRAGSKLAEVTTHTGAVTSLSYNRADGGSTLLSASRDNTLRLHHGDSLSSVTVAELPAAADATASAASASAAQQAVVFKHPSFAVASNWSRAAISPSGQFAVAPSTNGGIFAWSLHTGQFELEVGEAGRKKERGGSGASEGTSSNPHKADSAAVMTVEYAMGGELLASCDTAGNVVVWGS